MDAESKDATIKDDSGEAFKMPHTNKELLDEVSEDKLETPDVKCGKRDSKEIGCNGNRTEISSDHVEDCRIELSEDMKVSVDT